MDQRAINREAYGKLIEKAKQVAELSHSPYSKFPVGAALLTDDGQVVTGCNVESASFGATVCAERAAVVKAVSEGYTSFVAVAVYCKKAHPCWPCGLCRQFLAEFGRELEIVSEDERGNLVVKTLSELFPEPFGPDSMPR